MIIPNRRELQQIVFNHSLDIDFKDFIDFIYKKCTAKPYSFLVIDANFPSENLWHFLENLWKRYKNNHGN